MKLVTAIIKPFKLDDVRSAIERAAYSMTVTEIRASAGRKGIPSSTAGPSTWSISLPKIKVEVAVADEQLDEVMDAIRGAANTESIGDGKIFVTELVEVVRIRTGETGPDAV